MIILREYKSVVFWLIFVSLWIIGFCPCCNEEEKDEDETQEHFNVTSDIINSMSSKNKWTFFKITITPKDENTADISLKIEDIISDEYIHNTNKGNNIENVNNIDTGQNNINENEKVIIVEKNKDPKVNAFIVESKDVNFIVGEMGGNANNNNTNERKIINNKDGNNEEGTKRYYYVLVKDITTRKNEQGYVVHDRLFRALDKTAINNFTYSIEIVDANTTEVTDTRFMFYECWNLTKIVGLDKWNTSNVKNMSCMFMECSALTKIVGLENWNTSNVKDMSNMFDGCSALTSLPDISKWNTSNVTDMRYMFNGCKALKSIDISGWDTSNVTNMSSMFYECKALTKIVGLANWNTNNVTNMCYMFSGCNNLPKKKIPDNFKKGL